ncbi:unnamed protein product [Coffea canephora]|uniref:DH200=94 genomic scaffold, scaffold_159 n=1 Tax=Coffea canephora TaxID=49390 RepID=A0A068V9I0_COFCA|nr:unnamed protein product [Coffea canephora]
MECNGIDGRGLPAPKSDDSLPRGRTKERKERNGAVKAREVDSKQQATASLSLLTFLSKVKGVKHYDLTNLKISNLKNELFCSPLSLKKGASGLNAPTTAVQPFLGFVESGFPFTHNGGAAPTRQAATGHNALFAQQIHFEVDLFARPIVGMCTRYHKGPISQ